MFYVSDSHTYKRFLNIVIGSEVAFLGVFLIGLGTTWIRVLLQSIQQMASFRMIRNQASVVVSARTLGLIASEFGANFIYLSLMLPISICILFAYFKS